jgi:hypothetical protein
MSTLSFPKGSVIFANPDSSLINRESLMMDETNIPSFNEVDRSKKLPLDFSRISN